MAVQYVPYSPYHSPAAAVYIQQQRYNSNRRTLAVAFMTATEVLVCAVLSRRLNHDHISRPLQK